jgi:hypothetical protein
MGFRSCGGRPALLSGDVVVTAEPWLIVSYQSQNRLERQLWNQFHKRASEEYWIPFSLQICTWN